jgi:Fic family protein
MTRDLERLIAAAKKVNMTDNEKEQQRLSFAYGSAKIENEDITKDMIKHAAEKLQKRASYG